jgi:putative hydrolase of the HAD superfamily
MIRGVIFDYGSTLIYFKGDFKEVRPKAHQALVQALIAEGIALRGEQFLERFTRKIDEADSRRVVDYKETTTFEVLVATLREEGFPPQPPDRLQKALRAMYLVYEKKWRLFPDTHEALRKVRLLKLRMALVSNASDAANVHQMLKNHRLDKIFRPVVISAAIGVRKPDPRAFQPVLEAWKCAPEKIVMVGDQLGMDILGAQKLGMRTIWIRSEEDSSFNREFLGKVIPDVQVGTIGEAAAILAHWKKKG